MNAFPDDYVIHNLPLIVLSGLGAISKDGTSVEKERNLLSEGGFRIKTDIPEINTETSRALLQALLSQDASNKPWHGRGSGQADQNAIFRIHSVGRSYTLPPRKAPPPAHSPRMRPADGSSPPPQLILHSVISPLTPSSPLYPDGIMTPLWIAKHQSRLPSVFVSFFTLTSDSSTSTLQDNKLKSEINNMRSVLSSTNYKTRFVVVLISDGDLDASEVDDRLANIKRATNLDAKSLFYLAGGSTSPEVSEFATAMLNGLYAGCIEYYRDLSKHARRKRNRNIVPQPTVQPNSGTSRILQLAGWNVRYEFKLGVFAEFRQEMEAALRNYEAAYEALFGPEVFEIIPSWSPKFNESRLLSDIISIRIIRCLLWLGQSTNAVKWWASHRNRIQSLLDRRGPGTETYGWEAWQSIWSRTMAELIQRSQILAIEEKQASTSNLLPLFIEIDKTLPIGQRNSPWESLHHEGYWLNLAQRHTQNRRARALQMPEEDRASPGQSPASVIASKAHLYDRYLTLEPYKELPLSDQPGYDYAQEVVHILEVAVQHFSNHGQARMAEILQLKMATELIKSRSWEEATSALLSIWQSQSWRKAGWWLLLEQVGRSLIACASETHNLDLMKQIQWQVLHPVLLGSGLPQSEAVKDADSSQSTTRLQVTLDAENSLNRFVPAFTFATAEGHVGEIMDAQISLTNNALNDVPELQLLQIKIVFEGGLKPIYLVHSDGHSESADGVKVTLRNVELEDAQSIAPATRRVSIGAVAAVSAEADLSLRPGQVKVFAVKITPREAGDVSVASITMTFSDNDCETTVTTTETHETPEQWWEVKDGKPVPRLCGRERDAATAKILAKPPKVEIQIPAMQKAFYTDEAIKIMVESRNGEDQPVIGTISARLVSPGKNNATLQWKDGEVSALHPVADTLTYTQTLPEQDFGELSVGDRLGHVILINNADEAIDHELEIVVRYTMRSNPDTKLTKSLTIDLPVIRPFEANFSFHARPHEEQWPDFFSAQTVPLDQNEAAGIKQQYLITAVVCSFATEDVLIESTTLAPQKIVGGAVCKFSPGNPQPIGSTQETEKEPSTAIRPEETKRYGFDMTLQKMVLGNRQPIAIDVLLEILWKRRDSDQVNTSLLQVPRFLAPTAEPRVLLQTTKDANIEGFYHLTYTIENPSLHFLTFNLSMESSDDFAFSGTKSKSLSLVPISRHSTGYRILVSKTKAWVKVQLEVVDAYFGQTLKVQPASDGVRVDKQGNVLVWID